MQTRPEIVYEGMSPSLSAQARVEEELAKLEQFFGQTIACRVVIHAPGHHQRHGGLFAVRVHLVLPGKREIVASRNPAPDHAHEDALVAIRDAFRAARRQLQDKAREMQGTTKHRERPPQAIVSALYLEAGYGFLETSDGREVYFHRNSVLDDGFDRLEIGSAVTFAEEPGEKGPQASTVRPVGKHGLRMGEAT